MKEIEARDLMKRNQERFLDHVTNCRQSPRPEVKGLPRYGREDIDLTLRRVTARLKDW